MMWPWKRDIGPWTTLRALVHCDANEESSLLLNIMVLVKEVSYFFLLLESWQLVCLDKLKTTGERDIRA